MEEIFGLNFHLSCVHAPFFKKSLYGNVIFQSTGLLHKKEDFLLELQSQFLTKMAFFAHGEIFKNVVYLCTYDK